MSNFYDIVFVSGYFRKSKRGSEILENVEQLDLDLPEIQNMMIINGLIKIILDFKLHKSKIPAKGMLLDSN